MLFRGYLKGWDLKFRRYACLNLLSWIKSCKGTFYNLAQREKQFYRLYMEPLVQKNKFRTFVSEVSSFVDNLVNSQWASRPNCNNYRDKTLTFVTFVPPWVTQDMWYLPLINCFNVELVVFCRIFEDLGNSKENAACRVHFS